MASLSTKQIRELALDIIRKSPGGAKFKAIVRQISTAHPETNFNTVMTQIAEVPKAYPGEVTKPSRGLYVATNGLAVTIQAPVKGGAPLSEDQFYESFAQWLEKEVDEATVACELGGMSLKEKWGTPDVIGVYKPNKWNIVKFEPEIIAAEIKIDASQTVVAFGQAVAYRLFATKSYIVMPITVSEVELSRLEALCMLFGVGLVLFTLNPKEPDYEIRVRAQRVPPDMYYVNEFADRLRQSQKDVFERLFA